MNNKLILDYAKVNGLQPVAWFEIDYPAYAVKVHYQYPTSNPTDFRDRALLQLIDIGIPYPTACAILLIDDPHSSILKRFKSDVPQLVYWDPELNRYSLTELGRQRVNRIELARSGVVSRLIDGYTGLPFPKDVVKNLSENKFNWKDINPLYGELYPFEPAIEDRITELNAQLNEGKGDKYRYRLSIHEKARETSIIPLGPRWMTNLSLGIFLYGGNVVRRIFCDNSMHPVSPFGWLANPNGFKIYRKGITKPFCLSVGEYDSVDVFGNISSDVILGIVAEELEQIYGAEFVKSNIIEMDTEIHRPVFRIQSIDTIKGERSRLFSALNKGFLPIRLKGIRGSLFISLQPDSKIHELARFKAAIDESKDTWEEILDQIKKSYPDSWRKILITIGRHDWLFRHDVLHFITRETT